MNRSAALWCSALFGAILTFGISHVLVVSYDLGVVDDAYITARYARNWEHGQGLCFNTGERVEGFSSILLVAIETLALKLGVDPILTMRLVGRGSLVVLGGLMAVFCSHVLFPRHPLVSGLAGGLIGVNPALVSWSASGMESVLFVLLLTAGVATSSLCRRTSRSVLASVLILLTALCRPEGIAFLPITALAIYCRTRSPRAVMVHLALVLGGFGAYFSWRTLYFGEYLPMPFYAKLDYGSVALSWRGARYVLDFAGACPLLIVGIFWGVLRTRRAPCWVGGFTLAAAMNILVTVYEGGDHFPFFRFLLPAIPFLSVLLLDATMTIASRLGITPLRGLSAAACGLAALAISDTILWRTSTHAGSRPMLHIERFSLESARARQWSALGMWFKNHAPKDASLATIAIGGIGYFSDLRIIDPLGLITPSIAHKPIDLGGGLAGHEKYDVDVVLRQRPSYLLAVHVLTPFPVNRDELEETAWGAFNKALARNPVVETDYRYEVIPVSRLYANIFVRKDLATPGSRGDPAETGGTLSPVTRDRQSDNNAYGWLSGQDVPPAKMQFASVNPGAFGRA